MIVVHVPEDIARTTDYEYDVINGIKLRTVDNIRQSITHEKSDLYFGNSDRIDTVYEGGFKSWECQYDIIKHVKLCGSVLDLGCGVGCLGIFALKQHCQVDFIDYNDDVITHATIPNVVLNRGNTKNCQFYSGSWNELDPSLQYDYIVAADVLYAKRNHSEIARIIKTNLKEQGTCFIGTKSRYFGVDGDMLDFLSILSNFQLSFDKQCVHSSGIKRFILRIWKS